jgi:predicted RNA methylase
LNAIALARKIGVARFAREVWCRTVDLYYEWRFNVDTRFAVTREALGIQDPDVVYYVPMNYAALFWALRRVAMNPEETVFLDYGAGKGRALVVAATFPFKRVLGIELADSLVVIARRNVDRMRCRRARRIEVEQADAASYSIPAEVNLIYFFNPFKGKVLARVLANLRDSYRQHPRLMKIIFFNNDFFEAALKDEGWLIKTSQTRFLSYSCGIYETLDSQDLAVRQTAIDQTPGRPRHDETNLQPEATSCSTGLPL